MTQIHPDHAGDAAAFLIPHADFRERHRIRIHAPPGAVLAAVAKFRIRDDPLARRALWLREWPGRLLRRARRKTFDLDDFTRLEQPDPLTIAYGLIGAFWAADYGLVACASTAEFRNNRDPYVCKLLLTFTVTPLPDGLCDLTTETLVCCPSPDARRRFAPYWYLIRPVSGLLRRRLLGIISARARAAARP
ncbi:hypothetical protein AA12717_1131 [Gluconacetobacter sacchari DSM 12717]|uniref:DUF2867 domain-containing protein n=2 Tax=Gluconacetobacter sacchari TaxID=92759 RepID=A0A7W4IFE1_9PROT|nr:hypothetical protein [Gluconacetobacter sacchari]MBB2161881.1 hypothetical protein [Gluconacetobacter sacchari]GBQ22245.1 hypothetical protein AA12717_1131 [Gluconacetobacter sacchari DSM 12717]